MERWTKKSWKKLWEEDAISWDDFTEMVKKWDNNIIVKN